MNEAKNGEVATPSITEVYDAWNAVAQNTQEYNRLLHTDAAIAPNPEAACVDVEQGEALSLHAGCSRGRTSPDTVLVGVCHHESAPCTRLETWA